MKLDFFSSSARQTKSFPLSLSHSFWSLSFSPLSLSPPVLVCPSLSLARLSSQFLTLFLRSLSFSAHTTFSLSNFLSFYFLPASFSSFLSSILLSLCSAVQPSSLSHSFLKKVSLLECLYQKRVREEARQQV